MSKVFSRLSFVIALGLSLTAQADEWEFDYRINTQFMIGIYDLEDKSRLNFGNRFDLADNSYEVNFRPDFSLSNDRLFFSIKPRAEFARVKVSLVDGSQKTENEDEYFFQEWLTRAYLTDTMSISYGRENLQWGPALFLSASNPFLEINGRDRPHSEVGGMDYGRFVWVANDAWTASVIVNTDPGVQEFVEETNGYIYAVKLDYTGQERYFSLIPSLRKGKDNEDDFMALGFFGGANFNDALLGYVEGSLAEDGDSNQGLAGLSYTFTDGSNLVLEYYRQEDGCTLEQVHLCLLPTESPRNLERNRLFRRDYLFLQTMKDWDQRRSLLLMQVDHNLNDDSNRFILQFNRACGDNWSGFAVGTVTTGDEHTEFGALVKSAIEVGLELTF